MKRTIGMNAPGSMNNRLLFETKPAPKSEKKCRIRKNDYDEFEVPVPTPDAPQAIYFTDDKDDAIGTAKLILGADVVCTFSRGTYDAE